MVLHPQSINPIPLLTKEIAHQAFPKGNIFMTLRDELGTFYNNEDFAELYSTEGQPGLCIVTEKFWSLRKNEVLKPL